MASNGFRETTFQELINEGLLEIGDGYRAKNSELGGAGLIFLRAGHVSDTHIDFVGVERFHQELTPGLTLKVAKPGDTVITTKGNSTGRTTFVSADMPPFVYSPHLSFWRSRDDRKLVGGFLRYWSRGKEFGEQLGGMKASTDMAPYLSLTDQRRLRISLPPRSYQQAIARILGTIDDKIELNRRMNETLEGMARALFKSWFVDFDPVRAKLDGRPPPGLDPATAALFPNHFEHTDAGLLPKRWTIRSLTDIADLNTSTLSKSDHLDQIEYIEISEVSRGDINNLQFYSRGEEPSRARRRLRHGDTALSTVRPDRGAYFLALDPSPGLIASTGFAVVSPKTAPWSFVHAALTQPEIFEHLGLQADGGAYPAVRPEIVGALEVGWPDRAEVLSAFHRSCAPFYERAACNRKQSRTLAALRDALLPKLLSGEIRVRAAEKLVEEIA